jgi:hypothetical protein
MTPQEVNLSVLFRTCTVRLAASLHAVWIFPVFIVWWLKSVIFVITQFDLQPLNLIFSIQI